MFRASLLLLKLGAALVSAEDCGAAECAAVSSNVMLQADARRQKTGSLGQPMQALAQAESTHLAARAKPLQASSATKDSDALGDAIKIVETVNNGSHVAAEAKDLETNRSNTQEAMDVLSKAEEDMSVNDALHNGAVITRDQVNNVTGQRPMDSQCGHDSASCVEGDMKAASHDQLLLLQGLSERGQWAAAGKPWTGGVVKYCLASDVSAKVKHLWDLSMAQVHRAVPCISFQDVGNSGGWSSTANDTLKACDSSPAVFVQSKPGDGCWSFVGETSRTAQGLQLDEPGCDSLGTVIHELGHALGMDHEQSRPDRGSYVTVHWQNIKNGKAHNFDISSEGYTAQPYDYLSVMHYDKGSFSKNGSPTITTPGSRHDSVIGQDVGLSQADADQLAAMYQEVQSSCSANSIDSSTKGCSDRVGYDCASVTECDVEGDYTECCGCGGGLTSQCWSGQACPSPAPLPKKDHRAQCVEDHTARFSGYDCVVKNTCSYTIKVTCESSPNSNWAWSGPSGTVLPPYGTDVCTPGKCVYMKVAGSDKPTPAPTPAPTPPPSPAPTPAPTGSGPACGIVDYTHAFSGYPCVVKNECSYPITVRCSGYTGYFWNFGGASGYTLPPWNEVCTPGACSHEHGR